MVIAVGRLRRRPFSRELGSPRPQTEIVMPLNTTLVKRPPLNTNTFEPPVSPQPFLARTRLRVCYTRRPNLLISNSDFGVRSKHRQSDRW